MSPFGNKYHGVWPVLVTPFDKNGKIDLGCYRELVEWYLENGVAGLFASCLTSEMFHLEESERLALVRATVEQTRGRVPVGATGSLGPDRESHVRLSRALADAGVDAVVYTPPTFCENEASLEKYFMGMTEEVDADLGLYECPRPTKRLLPPEMVHRLALTERFGPYKETSCSLPGIVAKVRAAEGTSLSVMQANNALMIDAGRAGALGFIGLVANVVPRLAVAVWDKIQHPEEAQPLHDLMCLVETMIMRSHPLATKYLLAKQGLPILVTARAGDTSSLDEATNRLLTGGWRAFEQMMEHVDQVYHNNEISLNE